jgi:predicted dehydrogenase
MEQPATIYRAAIIGTGRIGHSYDDEVLDRKAASWYQGENRHTGIYTILPVNHAAAYQTTPGYQLVAAANRSEEKLREFGARRQVDALYTDYRTLLREEQPDVVSVCTRSPEKSEIVYAAAEAGVKAIVVEKAVATSMAEANAMIATCEEHGVLLAVNHPYRFSPMARASKALLDGGELGTINAVTVHAAGGMIHTGTHAMDMLRYWAGDVVELQAHIPNYQPGEDLPAVGTVQFQSGAVGFFDFTHGDQQSMEVRGTQGYITLSVMVGDGWFFRIQPTQPAGAARQYPSRLEPEPIGAGAHTMSLTQRLFADLHESLSNGTAFISTGRDGAAALELSLACHAAHLAGGSISLPLQDQNLRVVNR